MASARLKALSDIFGDRSAGGRRACGWSADYETNSLYSWLGRVEPAE